MGERGSDHGTVEFGDADAMRAYRHTAERQQDEQRERRRALDFKLLATFPINGALLALVSTSLPRASQSGLHLWVLAAIAAMAFIAYLWYAARAYRIQDWSERPDLKTLRKVAMGFPAGIVDAWIGTEIGESINRNEPTLALKGEHTWRAFLCTLALAALAITIAVVARVG